jgi:putative transport protein
VQEHEWHASFGRIKRGARLLVATPDVRLKAGDLVTVIGPPIDLARIVSVLGERTDERIDLDRREIDYRRIFVSRAEVAGRTLRELDLPRRFNAVVTRLRRGDVEFVPGPDTVIELGDRVRVLSRRANLPVVAKHLGDSYRALSEIDVMSFSLGCGLGLMLGLVPIPLPGGVTVRLGLAGGPLVVALILGNLGRTGNVVWTLPYNANLTLRQIGLILFLAGIGTRAGYDFLNYLKSGGGLEVLALGAAVTTVAAGLTLWIGTAVMRVPFGTLTGVLSGLQTQPAVLAFSLEQAQDETPNVGYATVYPVATIAKVVFGQLLLVLME